MIDPWVVVVVAAGIGMAMIAVPPRRFLWALGMVVAYALLLVAISYAAGYPTNTPFPSHAIVYGLTTDHVWAAPKDNPYPPRSYIFKAPPTWHEEKNKRRGEPFEVQQVPGEQDATQETNRSDRTSEGDYVIHKHILPPKGA